MGRVVGMEVGVWSIFIFFLGKVDSVGECMGFLEVVDERENGFFRVRGMGNRFRCL